jgi:hypothetical protein
VHALLELFDEAAGVVAGPAAAVAADTGGDWEAQADLQQPPRKRQRTGHTTCNQSEKAGALDINICAVIGRVHQSQNCAPPVIDV